MTRSGLLVRAAAGLLGLAAVAPAVRAQAQVKAPTTVRTDSAADFDPETAASRGIDRFAFDLYARLRSTPGNLFFSPYSIASALAMTSAGARGATDREMAAVLHLPADQALRHAGFKTLTAQIRGNHPDPTPSPAANPARSDPQPGPATEAGARSKTSTPADPQTRTDGAKTEALPRPERPTGTEAPARTEARGDRAAAPAAAPGRKGDTLAVANALWLQQGEPALPAFLQATRENFGAAPRQLDFGADPEAARRTINDWVEKRTAGKIRELVAPSSVDQTTSLVLTNAIYFKGAWLRPFRAAETVKDGVFHAPDGKTVKVPMMTQTASFPYFNGETFQVLELPYVGERRSMIVVLPRSADGLAGVEAALTPEALTEWLGGLKRTQVALRFPRFTLEESFQLADVLTALGMPSAFDPSRADFSGITGRRGLRLSAVIHKAFVDVNEAGTEAAAASAGVVTRSLPVQFKADHPFLFLILDRELGTLLFLGRVNEPKALAP